MPPFPITQRDNAKKEEVTHFDSIHTVPAFLKICARGARRGRATVQKGPQTFIGRWCGENWRAKSQPLVTKERQRERESVGAR